MNNVSSIYTMDCDRFIKEIMSRPAIWEVNHHDHKNKHQLKNMWDEIHKIFPEFPVDDLKKRWKNLRDSYRKELKRLPQARPGIITENVRSCWRYYDALSFLREQFGFSLQDDANQEAEKYVEVSSQSPASPASSKSDDDPRETPSTLKKRKERDCDVKSEILKIERKKMKILEEELAKSNQFSNSDNYHFLMSLLPEMDKLEPVQKMRLRTKISQALLDEISMSSYDEQPTYNESKMHDSDQYKLLEDPTLTEVKEENMTFD